MDLTVLTTSASGIDKADYTAEGCLRSWAFDKIDHVARVSTGATNEGSAIHAEIEDFYRIGKKPDRAAAQALIEVLPEPLPDALGPKPEIDFVFVWPGVPVLVRGLMDLLDLNGSTQVYDHKTKANLYKVKKDPELLVETGGAICYGAAARILGAPDYLNMQWNYVTRQKTPQVLLAPFSQSLDQLMASLKRQTPLVREMYDFKRSGKRAVEAKANRSACYNFGPCQYRDLCPDFPKPKPKLEEEPVDLNVLARLAALGASPSTIPVPTVPEPATPPETPPEGLKTYVAPKMGLLDTLRAKPSRPEIAPPDAQANVSENDPPQPPPPEPKKPRGRAKAAPKAPTDTTGLQEALDNLEDFDTTTDPVSAGVVAILKHLIALGVCLFYVGCMTPTPTLEPQCTEKAPPTISLPKTVQGRCVQLRESACSKVERCTPTPFAQCQEEFAQMIPCHLAVEVQEEKFELCVDQLKSSPCSTALPEVCLNVVGLSVAPGTPPQGPKGYKL